MAEHDHMALPGNGGKLVEGSENKHRGLAHTRLGLVGRERKMSLT